MLSDLVDTPVICAPMAGGPSTPTLVAAVSEAGGMGFLAAGYKSPQAVRDEIDYVRSASRRPFGINLFVPRRETIDSVAVDYYLGTLSAEAQALGVELAEPTWDDDDWADKLALLISSPVPVVSFTFGCPSSSEIAALHEAGSTVLVTVTSSDEAIVAEGNGADGLVVQGTEAGGHRSRFSDALEDSHLTVLALLASIAPVVDLDLIAAGGIMNGRTAAELVGAGAVAVQCGTAFLLCPESGTNPTHRRALMDPSFAQTAFTRAFSGRTARGLVNRVMTSHPDAPTGYPQINNATKPMRQAAARLGDAQRLNLWAGAEFSQVCEIPASEVVFHLSPGSA